MSRLARIFLAVIFICQQVPASGLTFDMMETMDQKTLINSSSKSFQPVNNLSLPFEQEKYFVEEAQSAKIKMFDFNGDGEFTQADAKYIAEYSVGNLGELSQEQLEKMDLNGDGEVNMNDAMIVMQILNFDSMGTERQVKLLSYLPVEAAAELLSGIDPEQAGEILSLIDVKEAADILSALDSRTASAILASDKISVETAAGIFNLMDKEAAAAILSEENYDVRLCVENFYSDDPFSDSGERVLSEGKIARILEAMDTDKAADVMAQMKPGMALIRLYYVEVSKAAEILLAMEPESAKSILNSYKLALGDKIAELREAMGQTSEWWKGMTTQDMAEHLQGLDSEGKAAAFKELHDADAAKAVDLISAIDAGQAADILSALDSRTASAILASDKISVETAAGIFNLMDKEAAAAILSEENYDVRLCVENFYSDDPFSDSGERVLSEGKIARILEAMDTDKAADVMAQMKPGMALIRLYYVEVSKAAEILLAMEPESAESILNSYKLVLGDKIAELREAMDMFKNWNLSPELVSRFDVNGDGKFTQSDIKALTDLMFNNGYDKNFDFNGNGKIDIGDISAITYVLNFNDLSPENKKKTLENLAPEEAAAIISAMHGQGDFSGAAAWLVMIDSEKAAAILSAMDADKAADIFAVMLNKTGDLFSVKEIVKALSAESAAAIFSEMKADDVARLFQGTLPLGGGSGEVPHLVDAAKAAQILSLMSTDQAVAVLNSDNLSADRASEILGSVSSSSDWIDGEGNKHHSQTWAINGARTAELLSALSEVNADKAASILNGDGISDGLKVSILYAMDAQGAARILASDNISLGTASALLQRLSYTDDAYNTTKVDSILSALDAIAPEKADDIREIMGLLSDWNLSPELISKFDVNGDGKFTQADIKALADMLFNNGYDENFDFNGNGKIDIGDVSAITYVLGFNELSEENKQKTLENLAPELAAAIISALCAQEDLSGAVDLLSNIDAAKAGEILSAMDRSQAVGILCAMDAGSAADIISAMDTEAAVEILAAFNIKGVLETNTEGLALLAIMGAMDETKAGELLNALVDTDMDSARFIYSFSSVEKRVAFLGNMDSQKAADLVGPVVRSEGVLKVQADIFSRLDPAKAAEILSYMLDTHTSAADILSVMDSAKAAAILSCMDADAAGAIISAMDLDKAVEIISALDIDTAAGIIDSDSVSAETAANIFAQLDAEKAAQITDAVNISKAVEIFSSMDQDVAESILNAMDAIAPEKADDIREIMGLLSDWNLSPELVSRFDVNGDGKFTQADIKALTDLMFNNGYDENFDFNGNGKIDIGDVSAITYVLGFNELSEENKQKTLENLAPELAAAIISALCAQDNLSGAVDLLSNIDAAKAGEILSAMDRSQAVGILCAMDAGSAADIISAMDTEAAVEILAAFNIKGVLETNTEGLALLAIMAALDETKAGELLNALVDTDMDSARFIYSFSSVEKRVAFLGNMDSKKAADLVGPVVRSEGVLKVQADIFSRLDPAKAAEILSYMLDTHTSAADILSVMDSAKAAAILSCMDADAAAEIIASDSVSPEKAADILSAMEAKTAAEIIASDSVSIEKAIAIFNLMDTDAAAAILNTGYWGGLRLPGEENNNMKLSSIIPDAKAAAILEGLDQAKAAAILNSKNMSADSAANIFVHMDAAKAAQIINEVDISKTVDILSSMDQDVAESILNAMDAIAPEKADDIREIMGLLSDWNLSPELVSRFDVNGDGKFTQADVKALADMLANNGYDENFDFNGNGKIDIGDLSAITYVLEFNELSEENKQKTLEALAPELAAAIISALCAQDNLSGAVDLLSNIDAAKAGVIISAMDMDKAAQIVNVMDLTNIVEVLSEMESETVDNILTALDSVNPDKADEIREALGLTPSWNIPALIELFDFNGDGKFTQADAKYIAEYSVGNLGELSQEELDRMDVNGDGEVNMNDAMIIMQILSFDSMSTERQSKLLTYVSAEVAGEMLSDIDAGQAAEILSAMDADAAAKIIASDSISTETAVAIFNLMDTDAAAAILNTGYWGGCVMPGEENNNMKLSSIISDAKAAEILTGIDQEKAGAILNSANMKAESAAKILNAMSAEDAAAFLSGHDVEQYMLEPWNRPDDADMKVTNFVDAAKAAEIIAAMDRDKAASVLSILGEHIQASFISDWVVNVISSLDAGEAAAIIASENISAETTAKIFSQIDAEKAAQIVNAMDLTNAVEVLSEMETAAVDNILNAMDEIAPNAADDLREALGLTPSWNLPALIELFDFNGDGKFTKADADYIAKYNVGLLGDLSREQLEKMDVNGDGEVNQKDTLHLLHVLDFPTKATEEKAVFISRCSADFSAILISTLDAEEAAQIIASLSCRLVVGIILSGNIQAEAVAAIFEQLPSNIIAVWLGGAVDHGSVQIIPWPVGPDRYNRDEESQRRLRETQRIALIFTAMDSQKVAEILGHYSVSILCAAKILSSMDRNSAFRVLSILRHMNYIKANQIYQVMMYLRYGR